jgi:hypothetical protein
MFPPLDRGVAYYAGQGGSPLPGFEEKVHRRDNPDPDPRHYQQPQQPQQQQQQYNGGGGDGYGGGRGPAGDQDAQYGRRARTVETDDRDRSRQDRLAQYQRELKEQMETEMQRKKQAAEARKREDRELDARVQRENEQRAQREKDDMARERSGVEARGDAQTGGARKKRDPNAGAGGAAIPAGPTAKFGRRADGDVDAKQAKEAAYRAELEQQRLEVVRRKELEAQQAKQEERQFDDRMRAWAESDKPLGQGGPPPPHQQQQQYPQQRQQPQSHSGSPNVSFEPGPPNAYYGGPSVSNSQEMQQGFSRPWDNQGPPGGDASWEAQQQGNNQLFGGPLPHPGQGMPPPQYGGQPQYGGGVPPPYGGPPPPQSYDPNPMAHEFHALRDQISMLLHQQRAQTEMAYQYVHPIPQYVHLPVPAIIAQPPPAHRGYAAQNASAYIGAGPYSGGPMQVQRVMATMGNAQHVLDRFLEEDDVRRDESLLAAGLPLLNAPPPVQSTVAPGNENNMDVRSSHLNYDTRFVRKDDDYLVGNIELDSEPAQFVYSSEKKN